VLRRQAFVAEVAVDLVHALEAADDETLQVQLRRDAQVHVEIERVVMRAEGARRGPAWDRLHHRRLDLEEVERIEEVTQVADDARASAEDVAARLVHDQVEVAPPVARFGVGEPVPLVGQRPQRLHQQPQRLDAHRELAGLGAEQHAARGQGVADVEALEGVVRLAEGLLLQVELNLPGAVGDLGEARLAHEALEHQPPADLDARRIGLEPLAAPLAESVVQLPGESVAAEIVRKWAPVAAQLRELRAPLGDQLVLVAPVIAAVSAPAAGCAGRFALRHLYKPALSEASMN